EVRGLAQYEALCPFDGRVGGMAVDTEERQRPVHVQPAARNGPPDAPPGGEPPPHRGHEDGGLRVEGGERRPGHTGRRRNSSLIAAADPAKASPTARVRPLSVMPVCSSDRKR